MYANLDRVKAQDIIHQGNYESTDWEGIYDLYLQAFGSEEIARKAQSNAAELLAEMKTRRS